VNKIDRIFNSAINEKQSVAVPPELASRYALRQKPHIIIQERKNGLFISSPTRLAKLYIEPTNQCNLGCRTCIRNSWEETMGMMSDDIFHRIISGLSHFSPPPTIFFGGFGEPLMHPKIADMIRQVKALGSTVELITNGTLLSQELSRDLIKAGIDVLWVSIDGSRPESYADIRLGAALPQVLQNVGYFQTVTFDSNEEACCNFDGSFSPQLGIVFVAMKRNIADLPEVIEMGKRLGATKFIVTNLLPYTREMGKETLYESVLTDYGSIALPRIDRNETTRQALSMALSHNLKAKWDVGDNENILGRCPFIENGAAAISWDGGFSPCLPLMHNHVSYYHDLPRFSHRWVNGNLAEKTLFELWNNPEHLAFREHVQLFDFAPCTTCYSCLLFENNEKDCIDNDFPTCGGCLWAQGIIQCP
jgi:MoaA/NifB/PqqE/SkfB family radical SAM enzyme